MKFLMAITLAMAGMFVASDASDAQAADQRPDAARTSGIKVAQPGIQFDLHRHRDGQLHFQVYPRYYPHDHRYYPHHRYYPYYPPYHRYYPRSPYHRYPHVNPYHRYPHHRYPHHHDHHRHDRHHHDRHHRNHR